MDPDDKELEAAFRPRLEAEQAEIERRSEATDADRRPVDLDQQSVGRLSRMDALQLQAMAKAVEQRRRARIVAVRQALDRLENGEFGYCLDCGEFIGMRRLEIDAATPKCVRCAV
ncbi:MULTISPECIES: molecular chaperone DnaK [Stappia]|jgi:DnaK suppressor protein|uniref:TraR/DksA family transcriptional regulator n=1 Tax=Stappia TaxID=152161 RepID=UPI00082EAD7E|nr:MULTISPECIES: molecular chaperone DnaK [Stappia]